MVKTLPVFTPSRKGVIVSKAEPKGAGDSKTE
jgi:hypothetical protein